MAASDTQAMQVAASQVVDLLQAYEEHVCALAATWLDMELYDAVSSEIDQVGRTCASLPHVALPWIALLISHGELVHCLLRAGQSAEDAPSPEAHDRLQEHVECVHALARRCTRLSRALSPAP